MIPDERDSTPTVVSAARFHYGALLSHPRTAHLATGLREQIDELLGKLRTTEGQRGDRQEKYAAMQRTDFEADDVLRMAELAVFAAVRKDRKDPTYRAAWPNGLTGLTSLRGAAQADKMRILTGVLRERVAPIAEQYAAEIERLAGQCQETERTWKVAVTAEAQAFAEEQIGRAELVRQLRKNEGALLTLFPAQKARVRSFFPASRRRSRTDDEPDTPSTPTGD